MKPQVYKDPRPSEYFDRFHDRQRRKRPNWMYELVRLLLTPYLQYIYSARCIDSSNIPAEGPVLQPGLQPSRRLLQPNPISLDGRDRHR